MARSFLRSSSQNLQIASGLGLSYSSQWTFSLFFRRPANVASGQIHGLMSILPNSGSGFVRLLLELQSGAQRVSAAHNTTTNNASATRVTAASNNTWYHATYTKGADTKVTLDGSTNAWMANLAGNFPAFQNLRIGSGLLSGDYCTADIAFPAVWGVELTFAERRMLAKGAHPFSVRPEDLIAFWPLDEKTGGARDIVGGYDLTASASEPTWVPDPPVLVRRPRRSQVWVGSAAGGGGKGFPFQPPMRGFSHMLVR